MLSIYIGRMDEFHEFRIFLLSFFRDIRNPIKMGKRFQACQKKPK